MAVKNYCPKCKGTYNILVGEGRYPESCLLCGEPLVEQPAPEKKGPEIARWECNRCGKDFAVSMPKECPFCGGRSLKTMNQAAVSETLEMYEVFNNKQGRAPRPQPDTIKYCRACGIPWTTPEAGACCPMCKGLLESIPIPAAPRPQPQPAKVAVNPLTNEIADTLIEIARPIVKNYISKYLDTMVNSIVAKKNIFPEGR